MTNNKYAIFQSIHNAWFIYTYFINERNHLTGKLLCIEALTYSNFSLEEIMAINDALNKGVRPKLDFTKISPDFHPINYNQIQFEKMFAKKPDTNPAFDPAMYLNLPPLTI
jgi:hypothetical protein